MIEEFAYQWEYHNHDFNPKLGVGTQKVYRDKNGYWYDDTPGRYKDIVIQEFENEYQKLKSYQREKKLKRILDDNKDL